MFSDGGRWNEIWRWVPKGELLPSFFGPVEWNRHCGSLGLEAWRKEVSWSNVHDVRCVIPSDLMLFTDATHVVLPFVWYGDGRLDDELTVGLAPVLATGSHLGWKIDGLAMPTSYAVADHCTPDVAVCQFNDALTIDVLGPAEPPDHRSPQFDYWNNYVPHLGLYISDRVFWHARTDPDWEVSWRRADELPEGAALPAPTGVCVNERHCP